MKINVLRGVFVQLFTVSIGCALCAAPGAVHAQAAPDDWQYSLTPYLWLPTIDGALKYNLPPGSGGNPTVKAGPTDWLDLLNAGALISGSAKKGRFTILADFVYLSLESKKGRVTSVDDTISVPGTPVQIPVGATLNVNTKTDFDGLMWSLAGGYAIKETERASVDVIAGVRYFGTDAQTSWDLSADITTPGGSVLLPAQGGIGKDEDLWDGIIGMRGRFTLAAEKWSVPFHFDVGAGSSDLTWQAMVGLSYAFDWGDFLFVYRHLEYDQDANHLFQDFSFTGPAFGARFHF